METEFDITATNTYILEVRDRKLNFGDYDYKSIPRDENGNIDVYTTVDQSIADDLKSNKIAVKTTITFFEGKSNLVLIEYINELIYGLKEVDKRFMNEGNLVIPNSFVKDIFLISLTTVRGILIEKLARTAFNKTFIPLIEIDYRRQL